MSLATIEVRGKSANAHGLEVRLNGEPVPGLVALQLRFALDDVNRAQLVISVDEVHVDAEALAILEGEVEPGDGCTHPRERRQTQTTMGGPDRWICLDCGFEYDEES